MAEAGQNSGRLLSKPALFIISIYPLLNCVNIKIKISKHCK